MDPGYETVVDFSTIWPTMVPVVIHVMMVALQIGLIAFLIGTGLLGLVAPGLESRWLLRLGAAGSSARNARVFGAGRIGLGVLLALPVAAGASFVVSLTASIATLVLLVSAERAERKVPGDATAPGRLARRFAIGSSMFIVAFAVWEGADGLALGTDILSTAQGWRMHELEWQLSNDVKAPKVGDMAPDFELQDPSGEAAMRLSDFRGKRPVALAFGSYT